MLIKIRSSSLVKFRLLVDCCVWTVLVEETRRDNNNGDIVVASLQQRLRTGTDCRMSRSADSAVLQTGGVLRRTSRDTRRLSSIPHLPGLPDRLHKHISSMLTASSLHDSYNHICQANSSSTFYSTCLLLRPRLPDLLVSVL